MKFRFQFDKLSDKWGVLNENGDFVFFSKTKEGAIQIMNDLNGVGR